MSGTYLNSTLAYCSTCNEAEQARIVARDGGVFMERLCPVEGARSVKVASDYIWYRENMPCPAEPAGLYVASETSEGCPRDCGPCRHHIGGLHLPVFSITNACNLDCNICFTYNRADKKYFKSVEETRKIIDNILRATGGVELINLTGGEPTLHPELFDILNTCKVEGIRCITMNTNGLTIANDFSFAEKMKQAGVRMVLSLNTFDPEKSRLIHGKDITKEKKQALETLKALEIPTTILSVCIKGVNEGDVAEIAEQYIKEDFVRSITIQNMTFTGYRGSSFEPREHITIDEVEKLLAARGSFSKEDFSPLGSYHPLCYSVAYYIVHRDRIFPLARLLGKDVIRRHTKGSYILDPDADYSSHIREGLDQLWAEGGDEELEAALRHLLNELYPKGKKLSSLERREASERMIKMLYIHPHMDEDNFDIDRVSRCGDLVPDESGRMVPACSYNLLYRQQDARFWREPGE